LSFVVITVLTRAYRSQIVAPSLIPRRAGERIKNDRRDCLRLAELTRAGELKASWVPDEAHEAMRNLWRAREDAVGMRLKTRQQLQAFLLRHGRRYPGRTNWTKSHERWIAEQRFEHDGGIASCGRSLQVAVSPCCATVLRDAISADPSVRVWTPTPVAPRVHFPFLPLGHRPSPRLNWVGA
jgi:transposase